MPANSISASVCGIDDPADDPAASVHRWVMYMRTQMYSGTYNRALSETVSLVPHLANEHVSYNRLSHLS